jgi:hypothetical protein
MIKTYSELMQLPTFEERFNYLKMNGVVSEPTFGWERYLNQRLYNGDPKWFSIRNDVIIRENGCDLGIPDRQIYGRIIVHHINPISPEQLRNRDPIIFDMNNLISVSHATHNAIHYGDIALLENRLVVERKPNDTKLW